MSGAICSLASALSSGPRQTAVARRPPGRRTRAASRKPASRSGKRKIPNAEKTASNDASSRPVACPSRTSHRTRSPAPRASSARAVSATISGERSVATTRPTWPASRSTASAWSVAARASSPPPHALSRTRAAGGRRPATDWKRDWAMKPVSGAKTLTYVLACRSQAREISSLVTGFMMRLTQQSSRASRPRALRRCSGR